MAFVMNFSSNMWMLQSFVIHDETTSLPDYLVDADYPRCSAQYSPTAPEKKPPLLTNPLSVSLPNYRQVHARRLTSSFRSARCPPTSIARPAVWESSERASRGLGEPAACCREFRLQRTPEAFAAIASSVVHVSALLERLMVIATVSFLALALAQGDASLVLVGGMATLVVVAVLSARYAAVSIRSHSLTVGARARAHRESLSSMPEPSHPDTAGRTRSRAPSRSLAAA
jgi:hypothetical protein